MTGAPSRLRVEHLDAPRGLTVDVPRLSWVLPPGLTAQTSYRVQVRGPGLDWDSGRVDSADHVLVPYAGPRVPSATRVEWRVTVSTDEGDLGWSEWSSWETGLMTATDWTARWIEPVGEPVAPAGERAPVVFRSHFGLDATWANARIYITAHGVYEVFVNGVRVGDEELAPGFTEYRRRLQVQTLDASDAVRAGTNHVVVVVSDGWWRGKFGFTQHANGFGSGVALLAEVRVDDSVVAATDETWRWRHGRILSADLMDGEILDLRRPDECDPRTEFTGTVRETGIGFDHLVGPCAPPVRRIEEITPVGVTRLDEHTQVVDVGTNINGWTRLSGLGPAGSTITLTHGELLGPDGDVTLDHLAAFEFTMAGPDPDRPVRLLQRDVVISDGATDTFEPRHTVHGFQYVRVEGRPDDLSPDDITAVVVASDLERIGSFECSDDALNALHRAVERSFLGNACDVPTDCPTRERAGWTGDWQVFHPTAAFLFDVAGFSTKWLRDLDVSRWPDGRVPNFVPDPGGLAVQGSGIGNYMTGSSGWGDASVIVPWDMWRLMGDRQILDEMWPMMSAWVDFAARAAAERRHVGRVRRSPDPRPHERFIWDTGFHWGEWCEPEADDSALAPETDHGCVATAFLHRSASLLGRIATVLGRDAEAEAERYERLANDVRAAWQTEFITPEGLLTVEKQAEYVRALAFGLVPDDRRQQFADRLAALVAEAGDRLSTGFLATPFLLQALADNGHPDVAYRLLLQRSAPSWLAMIDRGATTIWENWDGADSGAGSLNHYSKGAVASFLHTHVAGIRPHDDHPGYERFTVCPMPGGGLTWARAHHDSPQGRIESEWSLDGDRFTVTVTVPSGSTARLCLPGDSVEELTPGRHERSWRA
jgi:alpha-L-rhamnosidase